MPTNEISNHLGDKLLSFKYSNLTASKVKLHYHIFILSPEINSKAIFFVALTLKNTNMNALILYC